MIGTMADFVPRDGTSQAGRLRPELDPNYAPVDERTTRDLLAFAKAYAGELNYFSVDDPDRAQGDWSGFIGPAVDLDDAAAYATDPGTFSPETAAPYSRPHFALFLAFLELLGRVRAQFNALTRRHLEFFYRDVLKMVRKRAVPDQVHVLVDLETGTDQLAPPAGTALSAGKDSLGRALAYRTDRELIASQVQIAQISSLHAEIRITGIKEASQLDIPKADAFLAMVRIALGQPNPSDPLPVDLSATPRRYPGVPPNQPNPQVDFEALIQAKELIGVVERGLGMPSFDDFRSFVTLRQQRQADDTADWGKINAILQAAGRKLDEGFTIKPKDSTDFKTNVQAALQKTLDRLFDGLTEVVTIDDAYAAYINRPRAVEDFLTTALSPLSLDQFKTMMQIKVHMDNQWDEINRLLDDAGKHKRQDPTFTLSSVARASRNIDDKLKDAGLDFTSGQDFVAFTGGLDKYIDAFFSVERYFYMSAENFKYVMSLAPRGNAAGADEWAWNKVYEILAAAHGEMIYERRRNALKAVAQNSVGNLGAALAVALGEALAVDDALNKLTPLGVADNDRAYLAAIAHGTQPAPDWPRVYRVLEIAQRNRENFRPVAEKVEWRNLYPAPDATTVLAHPEQADAGAPPRWMTFGQGEQVRPKEPVPPPSFGWAIASPLLALNEGTRTVALTLGFAANPENFDLDKIRQLLTPAVPPPFNPFLVQVSTAKGWLEPESATLSWTGQAMTGYPAVPGVDTTKLRALAFGFTLAKGRPALTPPTRDIHGIDASAPVLRLMMKPVWNDQDQCYVSSYQVLRCLLLLRAHLAVTVKDLAGLRIRNDQTVLDPKKPFEPFGFTPATGSRFYVGHPEIVAKKLDTLSFTISWMGVPTLLATHYVNYTTVPTNPTVTAKVFLSDSGVLTPFTDSLSLFDQTDATNQVAITLTPPDLTIPDSVFTGSPDVTEWNRYIVWELGSPDLQHSVYPAVALKKSLELAVAMSNNATGTASGY